MAHATKSKPDPIGVIVPVGLGEAVCAPVYVTRVVSDGVHVVVSWIVREALLDAVVLVDAVVGCVRECVALPVAPTVTVCAVVELCVTVADAVHSAVAVGLAVGVAVPGAVRVCEPETLGVAEPEALPVSVVVGAQPVPVHVSDAVLHLVPVPLAV